MTINLVKNVGQYSISLVLLSMIAVGCSKSATKFGGSVPGPDAKNYASTTAGFKDLHEARIQNFTSKTFVELNNLGIDHASDEAFQVEGFTFDGIKSALEANATASEFLDDTYGTVGEFVAQNDIDLYMEITPEDVKESVVYANDFNTSSGVWAEFHDFVQDLGDEGLQLMGNLGAPNDPAKAAAAAAQAKNDAEKKKKELCNGKYNIGNYDKEKFSKMAAMVAQRDAYNEVRGTGSDGKAIGYCAEGATNDTDPDHVGYGVQKDGKSSCQMPADTAQRQIDTLNMQMMGADPTRKAAYDAVCN